MNCFDENQSNTTTRSSFRMDLFRIRLTKCYRQICISRMWYVPSTKCKTCLKLVIAAAAKISAAITHTTYNSTQANLPNQKQWWSDRFSGHWKHTTLSKSTVSPSSTPLAYVDQRIQPPGYNHLYISHIWLTLADHPGHRSSRSHVLLLWAGLHTVPKSLNCEHMEK